MSNTGLNIRNKKTVLVNQSGLINRKLDNLNDVDTTGRTEGSLLIYDAISEKFLASNTLEEQTINGGDF